MLGYADREDLSVRFLRRARILWFAASLEVEQ
jgi:hypothetical protein